MTVSFGLRVDVLSTPVRGQSGAHANKQPDLINERDWVD